MIDFAISDDLAAKRDRVRQFVIDEIIPYERDPRLTQHGPNDDLRQELVEKARAAGLLTIQAPVEYGGCTWNLAQHYIFSRELTLAGAPPLSPMGISMVAHAIVGFGTKGKAAVDTLLGDEAQPERIVVERIGNKGKRPA